MDPNPTSVPSLSSVVPLDISVNENASRQITLNMVDGEEVKTVADKIAVKSCANGAGKVCYAKAMFYFVRDNFYYVSDPNAYEYVKTAKMSLVSGSGDCDDASVLIASLLDAVGIRTRFVFVPNHVYVQAYLPEALNRYKEDGEMVNMDATCSNCEFGEIPYSNLDKEKRYLG
jgi:transglutaminase-like putative cysteine protease